jgi:Glycosyl transferase family 11
MVLSGTSSVAVKILGGLGNQLFKYSTGRALADRFGSDLILDCSDARDRHVELDQFNVRARFVTDRSEVRKTWLNLPGPFGRKVSKAVQRALPAVIEIDNYAFRHWREDPKRRFDDKTINLRGRIYLNGYWQSYRYFEDDRDRIRADLRLKRSISTTSRTWKSRIAESNSVCVHVRRGDYLLRHEQFGQCSVSYYQDAIRLLRSRVVNPRFFLFSDDLDWCRPSFASEDIEFVDCNGPDQVTGDLHLMRSCHHHIIANSTLSWWAAWLAATPGQIVVAPTLGSPRAGLLTMT